MMEKIVRWVPTSLLNSLRRSQMLRQLARRLCFPLFSDTVTIAHGIAKGCKFSRQGALISYLMGTDEPGLQQMLQLLVQPGMVACDIGANVGFFTIVLAKLVGEQGKVYAFEPRPDAAQLIGQNAALNAMHWVHVVPLAVADKTGEATFHVREMATTSSLCETASDDGDLLPVRIIGLDDFVFKLGNIPPSFIKMDVEGSEVEALQGMTRVLKECKPLVVIENHGRNAEVAALLGAAGYVTRVMGLECTLTEAFWNAVAVAAPPEASEVLHSTAHVCERR